jgi:hypothetical protein
MGKQAVCNYRKAHKRDYVRPKRWPAETIGAVHPSDTPWLMRFPRRHHGSFNPDSGRQTRGKSVLWLLRRDVGHACLRDLRLALISLLLTFASA